MSYQIIKSITIKDNKVYVNSAPNNVYPRNFKPFEIPDYTKTLNQSGFKALVSQISKEVYKGSFHLMKGSKLAAQMKEAAEQLSLYSLDCFLDQNRYCDFISKFVTEPDLDVNKTISELNALKKDKNTVIEILTTNAGAYSYISPELQKDRDLAQKYVEECGDRFCFSFPLYFKNDRELSLLAVQKSGTTFRQLSEQFRGDKEIILTAFKNGEHLPDLISEPLASDKEFFKELIKVQPRLHFERAPASIKNDKEICAEMLEVSPYISSTFCNLSPELRGDKDLQQIALSKAASRDTMDKLENFFTKNNNFMPLSEFLSIMEFDYSVDPYIPSKNNSLDGSLHSSYEFSDYNELNCRMKALRGDFEMSDLKSEPINKEEYLEMSCPMVSLLDLQGANLGGIESERFQTDSIPLCISSIIDRLDTYINDYFISDFEEQFKEQIDAYEKNNNTSVETVEDIVKFMEDTGLNNDKEHSYEYYLLSAINNCSFYIDKNYITKEITLPLHLLENNVVSLAPDADLYQDGDNLYSIDLECTTGLDKYIKKANLLIDSNLSLDQAYIKWYIWLYFIARN